MHKDKLRKELEHFVNFSYSLDKEQQIEALEHIIKKNDDFKEEATLDYSQFVLIMDGAKSMFTKLTLPMFISKREIEANKVPHIAVIEALIAHLNGIGYLKKNVKIDYKR